MAQDSDNPSKSRQAHLDIVYGFCTPLDRRDWAKLAHLLCADAVVLPNTFR